MYKEKLQFDSQVFEEGMTIPANTNDTADTPQRVGGHDGRLAVTIKAATSTLIHDEDILTVTFLDGPTSATADDALSPLHTVTLTMTADTTYAAGDEIISIIIPRGVNKWMTVNVATDDAGATGTIDIYLEYLAN